MFVVSEPPPPRSAPSMSRRASCRPPSNCAACSLASPTTPKARECARTIAGWKPLPAAACRITQLGVTTRFVQNRPSAIILILPRQPPESARRRGKSSGVVTAPRRGNARSGCTAATWVTHDQPERRTIKRLSQSGHTLPRPARNPSWGDDPPRHFGATHMSDGGEVDVKALHREYVQSGKDAVARLGNSTFPGQALEAKRPTCMP